MARMQRKSLATPDEVRPFTHGRAEIWELGDAVIGKQVFEPGWRWSNDVMPVALTDTCEYHHLGIVMSGRLRFITPDGLEMEVGPGMISRCSLVTVRGSWETSRASSTTSPACGPSDVRWWAAASVCW